MADSFTDVSHTSFGGNLKDSIGGVLFGLLLFVLAFPVLWFNEGRHDISAVAKKSKVVDGATLGKDYDGQLVAVTGELGVTDPVGDPEYLKPGKWVKLSRKAEMYAWVEHSKSETTKNVGGSSDTKTTYTYTKEWTTNPSTNFKHPEGHENPNMSIKSKEVAADKANVGVYHFRPGTAQMPSGSALSLDPSMTTGNAKLSGDYILIGNASVDSPKVGDVRISYQVIRPDQHVTLFGEQHGADIEAFTTDDDDTLYRLFTGDRKKAIEQMHGEFEMMTWIFRLVGFLMMWFGLGMLFGPINAILDVLPFLGSVGKFIVFLVMFPVAFVIASVVIIISMILHSTVMLILVLLGICGGGFYYVKNRKPKSQPAV